MKIRTVTSLRHFDELGALWREVAEAGGQGSLLTSHEWFACCWRTAGPSRARELWIVEDAAGPLALLPLVRARLRYRGFPARAVQLMHAPESPTGGFPVGRDVEDVMALVVEQLCARNDWDVLVLPGMPADSPAWKAFEAAAGPRFSWQVADRAQIPHVALSRRDPSLRKALQALRDAVTASGTPAPAAVTIEEHRDLDPRGPLFEDVMEIVRTRASRPASLPAATREDVRRFFRELTARATTNGWLSLWLLRLDGRVVEAEYQLAADGWVHALRRDADPSPPELRLGDALTLAIVEALLARPGVHTYSRTPRDGAADGLRSVSSLQETLVVEAFAPRPYANFLHHVETHVLPLARRLGGNRESPCA